MTWIVEFFDIKTERNQTVEVQAEDWKAAVAMAQWLELGRRVPIVGIRPK